MTDDIIARLRDAYAASTQGEWEFSFQCVSGIDSHQSGWRTVGVDERIENDVLATTYDVDDTPFPQAEENGRFIALSHNHMPAILAVLEASEAMADLIDQSKNVHSDKDRWPGGWSQYNASILVAGHGVNEAVRALREAK